ncbi:MAG: leucyl aminopeptidase family protein [Opitutales bacterium]|nr:leucyl aminopeptidase family protein [Opitutales bacterium]
MELSFAEASGPAELNFCPCDTAHEKTGVPKQEFSGAAGSVLILREAGRVVAWAGLGSSTGLKENDLRRASGIAIRKLIKAGQREICINCGIYSGFAKAIAEGAVIGAFHFEGFKSEKKEKTGLERLVMSGLDEQERAWASEGAALGEVVNRVRELGNQPPNIITPAELAVRAEQYVRRSGATMRVWDEYELGIEGFGGHLAVGSGSVNPPRFILLEREVDPSWPTVAIVGKAVTFDSGGISIKPAKGMEEMKLDKMGGLAALGILDAVALLKIPVNLVVAVCAAENMPGNNACRPSDVITLYGGKTVEVLNTDAEGRLVLADGLAYVAKRFSPSLTIDIATLTGACCVALGMERTGLFTSDDELASTFHEAGEASGDRCWRLPLGREYSKDMESDIADLRNSGSSRWGGASKAAAFLEHFKGEGRWVHLDIAGSGMPDYALPHMEGPATGAGVLLVAETLAKLFGR